MVIILVSRSKSVSLISRTVMGRKVIPRRLTADLFISDNRLIESFANWCGNSTIGLSQRHSLITDLADFVIGTNVYTIRIDQLWA